MRKLLFFSVGILLGLLFFTKAHAQTIPPLKVTICHWDNGQGGKYTTNSVNINSVTDCQNAGGHDSHSQDIIPFYAYGTCIYPGKNFNTQGQVIWNNNCTIPTPTITPPDCGCHLTPSPSPTVIPTISPTEEEESPTPTTAPSITPTPTATPTVVTPTPTQGGGGTTSGGGDGRSDGLSSCPSCTQAPGSNAPVQAVLGASTMASTGTFDNVVMNFMFVLGTIILGAGIKSYAKEKNS